MFIYLGQSISPIVCALLSQIHTKRERDGSLFALKIKHDIKARSHEATFMLWRGCAF